CRLRGLASSAPLVNDIVIDNQPTATSPMIETMPSGPVEAVAGGRSQAMYARLQREIMLGQLKPRAVVLELELAQRFGVSQGTVREALLRLQEVGLVHRLPHRGTTVADCRAVD